MLTLFAYVLNLPNTVMWILIALSALLYGPATCGLTYILRNFARQEHAWTFSDFVSRAKSNFKQGVLVGIIDILLVLGSTAYVTLNSVGVAQGQPMLEMFRYVSIVVLIIYMVMRFYIYTLIVTFDMSFRAIIKNSWIFTVLGFGRNILSLIFIGVALAASVSYMLGFFLAITPALCRFIAVFNGYPVIEKYMLKPMREENGTAESEIKPLFEDDVTERGEPRN
jgi:uncharacterized membrane protein YesL